MINFLQKTIRFIGIFRIFALHYYLLQRDDTYENKLLA